MEKYFTSESVTEGHPDKLCDQISDAVLDEILAKDFNARVACEAVCTTGLVVLFGEITANCRYDLEKTVREVIRDVGYSKPEYGFFSEDCKVVINIDEQSSDIAVGVGSDCFGAGDQGLVFGFACDETSEFMPMPIYYAHMLAKRLSKVRKLGILPYLRPDGKTQVTVKYRDGIAVSVSAIVVSAQHDEGVALNRLKQDILDYVIFSTIPPNLISNETKFFINPTGRFVIGGPCADGGLTGRKLMVDCYGGYARHGGGAFSGKDPTKVDRSGAYFARYVAKNIVAAGLAKKCEIQLAYAIGVSEPISLMVNSFGSGVYSDEILEKIVRSIFCFAPKSIIDRLKLNRPIYRPFASYGHFGRSDIAASWEQLDSAEILKKEALKFKENVHIF